MPAGRSVRRSPLRAGATRTSGHARMRRRWAWANSATASAATVDLVDPSR